MTENETESSDAPLLEELVPGSEMVYVIFGGIAQGIGMPPFEFYRSSRILGQSRVFVRDLSQSWYQAGLPGLARDAWETGAELGRILDRIDARRVVFVGNSMGGFAAILFSTMLRRGRAIAFAPQTFVSPRLRWQHTDRRWASRIRRMYVRTIWRRHVYDLRAWLRRVDPAFVDVEIHASSMDPLDCVHARHLDGIPGVRTHLHDAGGHLLVKRLRDSGDLATILRGEYPHASEADA